MVHKGREGRGAPVSQLDQTSICELRVVVEVEIGRAWETCIGAQLLRVED